MKESLMLGSLGFREMGYVVLLSLFWRRYRRDV